MKYYAAEHDLDPSVSQIVKARASVFRKHGIPSAKIGKFEIILLNVSTANAIPTAFWLCEILADPVLTKSIRDELAAMVGEGPKRPDGKRDFSSTSRPSSPIARSSSPRTAK